MLLLLLACATKDTPSPADSSPTGDTDSGATDTTTGDRYHPDGFSSSSVHGIAAKYQEDDCLSCHGTALDGGTAGVACDDCHASDWQTDCTFCHGGTEDQTGAPPEDIDDQDTDLSFPAHGDHVNATIHTAWGCDTCHAKPTEALSAGHFLVDDATPGVAEVDLSAGLSPDGDYSGGTCSNLYCHGDGQGGTGTVSVDDSVSCGDCHAGPDNSSGWPDMSGEHNRHLGEDVMCSECHPDTVSDADEITGLDEHVNGTVTYTLPEGISEISGTCNGVCHSEIHLIRSWY